MTEKSGRGRELLWLGVFGAAFGYLEAAVVIYLRAIVYPHGFSFPLAPIPPVVLGAEVGREAATVAMLAAVALAPGGPRLLKFSRFLYAFGLWDVFYYGGLKALLGWPASFGTWDILFLIPVPWSAPVLAPALVAAFFVAAGAYGIARRGLVRAATWHWLLGAAGAAGILATFLWNAGACLKAGMPAGYPWVLFGAAFAALLAAAGAAFGRTERYRRPVTESTSNSSRRGAGSYPQAHA
jgi:hypothetical protein